MSLVEFKRREEEKKQAAVGGRAGGEADSAVDFRNQMLITIALLAPDAQFQVLYQHFTFAFCNPDNSMLPLLQVTLNATHPWDGLPSVSAADSDSSSGTDKGADSSRKTSPLVKRHKKKFDPTDIFDPVRMDTNTSSKVRNIVPQALSERDTLRLAWAVARVREIVRGMVLQGHAVAEVSPGPGFGGAVGNASSPAAAASTSANPQSGAALTSWVSSY